jgi:hypothetical protein
MRAARARANVGSSRAPEAINRTGARMREATSASARGSPRPPSSATIRIDTHDTDCASGPPSTSLASPEVLAPAPSATIARSGTPAASARSASSAPIDRPRIAT